MKYDDGFVAYLNGTEVARASVGGTSGTPPSFDTTAIQHDDGEALQFVDFPITNLLQFGTNVLAIHGLNTVNNGVASSNMLILPELVGRTSLGESPTLPIYFTTDGSDPRDAATNQPAAGAMLFDSAAPPVIDESQTVTARAWDSAQWSAATEALFVVEVPLRVTEIMYNPDGPDEKEFIELVNDSSNTISLAGVYFDNVDNGIDFTFDAAEPELGAGQRIVVVRNAATFDARYDIAEMRIAIGQYDDGATALSNAGEMITLRDKAGGLIQSFTYSDDWYKETDGDDFSLVVLDTQGNYDDPATWRSSARLGGSPGVADPVVLVGDINGDGNVDRRDAAKFVRNLGRAGDSNRSRGDLNGDLATTLLDLALLQANLGAPSPSPQAIAAASITSPVPEAPHIATDAAFADLPRHARREARVTRFARRTNRQPVGNVEVGLGSMRDADATISRTGRRHFTSSLRAHRSPRGEKTQPNRSGNTGPPILAHPSR